MVSRMLMVLTTALVAGSCRPTPPERPAEAVGSLGQMIRAEIEPCWERALVGLDGTSTMVSVQILLAPDGSVTSARPLDATQQGSDRPYRAVAQAAVAAVKACSPLALPPARYQDWKNIVVNFRVS